MSVGKVASKAGEESDPTVDVTITLRGHRGELDQAPVDVGFAVEQRRARAGGAGEAAPRPPGAAATRSSCPMGRKLPVEAGLYAPRAPSRSLFRLWA